ncbi:hypothetical protein PIB30_093977 [Stylosanthes scabra]|uniref:Ubiquitin-like protease family profile domain-containing protein n=1 Tax=Stylosanthes scabra TaxID=79078 RepID=A0ABU6SVN7_9FABA|nr:hypothetical protein [Stylosanthes scabra]
MLSEQIVEAFSARLTMASGRPIGPKFWCLPPSFGDDVRGQRELARLLGRYKDIWMRPSSGLKYAYLPVLEDSGHWFMGVICFQEQAMFYLDASKTSEEINDRKAFLGELGEKLAKMVTDESYLIQFTNEVGPVGGFRLRDAGGLPGGVGKPLAYGYLTGWQWE